MKKGISFAILLIAISSVFGQVDTTPVQMKAWGIKINVTDMDKAIDFYSTKMGFEVESREFYPKLISIKSNTPVKIFLNLVSNLLTEQPNESHASITFQVNNLDSSIMILKSRGVDFGINQKQKEGVGYSMKFSDPFGTTHYIMQVTMQQQPVRFKEPKLYNYGVKIADMDKAREFYKRIGFKEAGTSYLPLDLVILNPDRSFAYMLHFREGTEAIRYHTSNDQHVALLFATTDLNFTIEQLKNRKIEIVQTKVQESSIGKYISFRDSFGMVFDLVELK